MSDYGRWLEAERRRGAAERAHVSAPSARTEFELQCATVAERGAWSAVRGAGAAVRGRWEAALAALEASRVEAGVAEPAVAL